MVLARLCFTMGWYKIWWSHIQVSANSGNKCENTVNTSFYTKLHMTRSQVDRPKQFELRDTSSYTKWIMYILTEWQEKIIRGKRWFELYDFELRGVYCIKGRCVCSRMWAVGIGSLRYKLKSRGFTKLYEVEESWIFVILVDFPCFWLNMVTLIGKWTQTDLKMKTRHPRSQIKVPTRGFQKNPPDI